MYQNKTFILAISGGVDSVVMLHKLMVNPPRDVEYVVAHFDHGIRKDSHRDAGFVKDLAEKYGLKFELGEGNLGKSASEEQARNARYKFLRSVASKYLADKIITAHHQDDLLETMIINILRGTSPRGLAPMRGFDDILRPLINSPKSQLLKYANDNGLKWREDPTNSDEKYMRNYVRKKIMPKIEPKRQELLDISRDIENKYHDIDMRINNLLYGQKIISRSWFVCLPYSVQREYIRAWLVNMNITNIDKQLIERVTIACKTLPAGKRIDIVDGLILGSEKYNLHFSR